MNSDKRQLGRPAPARTPALAPCCACVCGCGTCHVGDFFQLPPVTKRPNEQVIEKDLFLNWGFLFQCPAWQRCRFNMVLLTKVRDGEGAI